MAANPTFYKVPCVVGTLDLTTSYQTAFTADGSNGADIVSLYVTNEAGTATTISFADASDVLLGVINVPASAGQNSSTPPVNLLKEGIGMPGLEPSPYGGFIYPLGAGEIFRVKVSTVNSSHVRLRWKRRDF